MEKKRIRYAEFPAPIKAKMTKGIAFGILAVILTGIIAYILSRAEIIKAGAYVFIFAGLYWGWHYYYAATDQIMCLSLTVKKVQKDRLMKNSTVYTMTDAESGLYTMTQPKIQGRQGYKEGDMLDIYVTMNGIGSPSDTEDESRRISSPFAIVQRYRK